MISLATMTTETEELGEIGDNQTSTSPHQRKSSKGGWLQNAVQNRLENLTGPRETSEKPVPNPSSAELPHLRDQNIHKKEVIDYVDQRLKQLPIERDEQAALNQLFRQVIGESSRSAPAKMTDVPVKPSEPSQDLLEVSKLEHVEAMKRSFRQLSRLGTEEVRRLYNMENINRVRSAIFQLRQIQANRRSDVFRWQALKRRQTSMGNAHVRAFPSGYGFGYTCYFCSVGFKSVADLHAHLLTQEHLCIRLAPGTKFVVDQKRTSVATAEEQTNNSNAAELESEDQETSKKDDGLSFPSRSLRRASKIKGRKKSSQVKMMLSVYRCMYCGTYLYKSSIHDHRCLREVSSMYCDD